MATCKDCIHERVCEKLCPKGLLPYHSSDYPAETFCLEFKDKSQYAEVKHGEWNTTDTPLGRCCICSVCRSCPTMEYNYCPYCGAKMDKK